MQKIWHLYCLLLLSTAASVSTARAQNAPIVPQTAAEIYHQAREAAQHLRTIDYSFRVSHYPDEVQRVRADGLKIRVDAKVPEKLTTGMAVGELTDAFNGELHQRLSGSTKQLAISRVSVNNGTGINGPCLTPLEECYRWLKTSPGESIWSCLGSNAAWENFTPKSKFEFVEINGQRCVQLNFDRDNGVQFALYLSPELNWFPVKREVFSPDGLLAGVTLASNFSAFAKKNSFTVWLPRLIEVRSQSAPNGPVNRSVRYDIPPDMTQIGPPIPKEIFTLNYEGVSYIYDLDANEVYSPGSSVKTSVGKIESPPLNQREGRRRASSLRYLFLMNALFVFALIGLAGWKMTRKASR